MIGRLLAIEWLKARRRKSFWLTWLAIAVTVALPIWAIHSGMGPTRGGGRQPVVLGWPMIISFASGQGMLVMVAGIALLTASEKGWRTQRQNLIDGLSRTEYFAAKGIGALMMALLYFGFVIVLASTIWWIESRAGGPGWVEFTLPEHYKVLGGFLLNLLFIGAVALFFSLLCNGVGAALALSIGFFPLQGIVVVLLGYLGSPWDRAIRYLPTSVMETITSARSYVDSAPIAGVQAEASPAFPAWAAVGLALLYIALAAAGGWLLLERRDA